MPVDLVAAVLEHSGETGRASYEQVPAGNASDVRYNPFDLSLYRSWWDVDKTLSAARLHAAGPDAYVEVRIVGRLRDPALVVVLPAVALLGRFDEEMLAPACTEIPLSVGEIMQRLAEQEWIDSDEDMLTDRRLLQIEEPLQPRLLKWAQAPERRSLLDHARSQLLQPLRTTLASQPLRELGVRHVLAALRLCPGGSATTWDELEQRVTEQGAEEWFATIVARVAGEIEEGRLDDPLLIAAVQASAVASQRLAAPLGDYVPAWNRVADLVRQAASGATEAEGELVRRLQTRRRPRRIRRRPRRVGCRRRGCISPAPLSMPRTPRRSQAAIAAAVEGVVDACVPATLIDLLPALDSCIAATTAPDVQSALLVAKRRASPGPAPRRSNPMWRQHSPAPPIWPRLRRRATGSTGAVIRRRWRGR